MLAQLVLIKEAINVEYAEHHPICLHEPPINSRFYNHVCYSLQQTALNLQLSKSASLLNQKLFFLAVVRSLQDRGLLCRFAKKKPHPKRRGKEQTLNRGIKQKRLIINENNFHLQP